ncbi:hypothetical protein SZ60_14235 [Frigoribacterium sp. MEB024]|nr:hypothetical protein SZ60_14235 [Frigoribacterium sp. MEB024]
MKDGRICRRVQFRLGAAMRSKSFKHEAGARQFGGLIDRVGAAAALAMWEARQPSAGDGPTFRDWVDQYVHPDSVDLMRWSPGTSRWAHEMGVSTRLISVYWNLHRFNLIAA